MKKPQLAEVVPLYETNASDVVAMLRAFADEVEAGEHGENVHVVSVISTCDGLHVRGWGKLDGLTAIANLNLGLAQMVNRTLAELEEE